MKKILLIDDEAPAFGRVFPRLMSEYEVRLESEAGQAVKAAREFGPDVFLIDLIMPEINGLELAATFSKDAKFKGTPVIIISACIRSKEDGEPSVVENYPAFGKPFSIPALKRCIERELSKHDA